MDYKILNNVKSDLAGLVEMALLVLLLAATVRKDKTMSSLIQSRIVFLLIGALSTFIATEYPQVMEVVCAAPEQ